MRRKLTPFLKIWPLWKRVFSSLEQNHHTEVGSNHHTVSRPYENTDHSWDQPDLVYRVTKGWGQGQGLQSPRVSPGASCLQDVLVLTQSMMCFGLVFIDTMLSKVCGSQSIIPTLEDRHWNLGGASILVGKRTRKERVVMSWINTLPTNQY